MAPLDSRAKDPRLVAAGKKAMAARWGPQRVVRLDSLDPITAGNIRAILTARAAASPEVPEAVEATSSALLEVAAEAIDEMLGAPE